MRHRGLVVGTFWAMLLGGLLAAYTLGQLHGQQHGSDRPIRVELRVVEPEDLGVPWLTAEEV